MNYTESQEQKKGLKAKIKDEIKLFKQIIEDEKASKCSKKEGLILLCGATIGMCAAAGADYLLYKAGINQIPDFQFPLILYVVSVILGYLAIRRGYLDNCN